MIYATHSQRK